MRIRITHETTYRYSEPVKSAVQILRLTPRGTLLANDVCAEFLD